MILPFGLFLIDMIAAVVWTLNREAEETRREKWETAKRTVEFGSQFVTRETTLFPITAGSWYRRVSGLYGDFS